MQNKSSTSSGSERAAIVMNLLEVAAIVFALDQLTKFMIIRYIPLYQSVAPIPGLGRLFLFTHTQNSGAAFGIFRDSGNLFLVIALLVAVAIVYYVATSPHMPWLLRISLGLQMGGALGNMWDRVRHGAVTDFVDIGFWAIFNIADASIVIGVVLLAYWLWQEDTKAQQQISQQ